MLPLPNEQIQVLNLPKALKKEDSKTFKHSLNLRKGATKNCHSPQRVTPDAPINTNEDGNHGTMLVVYVCMAHVSCFQSLWYNIYDHDGNYLNKKCAD